MSPDLTPEHVHDYTGVAVVAVDIADALEQIARLSGTTADDHVDVRGIPNGNVRRAVAIVAARLRQQTAVGGEGLTSETDGDYTYQRDLTAAGRLEDLLTGLPRRLLGLTHATWGRVDGDDNRHPFWTDLPLHDSLGHHESLGYLMG